MTRKLVFAILMSALIGVPGMGWAETEPTPPADDAPAILDLGPARAERLSTRDRWRGAPYVRSEAERRAQLRSRAFDRALPVQSPLGTAFGLESESIRSEAMDMAIPIQNPAMLSGFGAPGF